MTNQPAPTLTEPAPSADGGPGLRTGSLRARVIVLVLVLLTGLLLVLGLTTDLLLRERLRGQLEDRLLDRARVGEALADQLEPQALVERLEGDGISVRLTTGGQTYRAGPLSPTGSGDAPPAGPEPEDPGPGIPGPEGPGPPAPGPGGPGGVETSGDLLQVTRTLTDTGQLTLVASASEIDRTLSQVRTALLIGSVMVLALAALLLAPVIQRALHPLEKMTQLARSIASGDRGRRLRPDRPATELGRTAAAFDNMLDTIEGAEAQATRSEARLRSFLADAAHELRTPLTAIQAAAEQLIRDTASPAEREALALTTARETRHASRLVEHMLTMASIDRGLDLQQTPCDLLELAQHTVTAHTLMRRGTHVELDGEPVQATVDVGRITQVLNNLLDNAIRAAGPTGHVQLQVSRNHDHAHLDVLDDGPGIPAADRDRIFDRFVRLDTARTRDHGGAGLGLAIARGIARSHGGELAHIPTTTGTRMRLTLPLRAADRPAGP